MNKWSKMPVSGLIVVILTLISGCLFAQQARLGFKHINIETGLSNSTIEMITQDSKGFIWIGTRDGLNRYDGHEMIVYKNNLKDSTSISDNYIQYICEDSDHDLWIGTSNGLNRFNRAKNNFSRFKHADGNPNSLGNNSVTAIVEDSRKKLWIASNGGGLELFEPARNKFFPYLHQDNNPNSLGDNRVNCIFEDRAGKLWIGTESGLNLFDPVTAHFTTYRDPAATEAIAIKVIRETNPGELWIGTKTTGLILFNIAKNKFRYFKHDYRNPSSLETDLIKCLLIDHSGSLWIGSINGGLEMYDSARASFIHYQNEPDNALSLSQRSVSALFEDNQHNLWVGTHRGGINLFMPGAQKFNLYRQQSRPQSLSLNDVKTFCEDHEGRVWIGTDGGGMNLFDSRNNSFQHYKYNLLDNHSLASDAVLDIMEDNKNNLWVSTWSGGLNLFNPKTGSFTRFLNNPEDKTSISSNFVQKAFEDQEHNLWVATYYGGLNLLDRNKGKFTRFLQASPGNTLSGNNIIALNQDKKGRLWIGTDDGGLNCYISRNKQIEHYFNNDEKMPDLRVIFIDSKDRVWIGQKGLYQFNESNHSFSLFTDSAGLSTEFIKGITEDELGNFWISTSNGITKFNPDTKAFEKYNTEDGLQGLEFETGSYLKTRNGEIFFGGMNGFNSFYPSNIKINTFKPPVYITSFQVFNEDMNVGRKNSPLQEDITLTKEIRLSFRQSTFSFNFSALNYTSAENNKYSYRLEGFDHNWIDAGKERRANYTNLNPGEYTFHVRASNNDGVWNPQDTSVKIVITPPFWKTDWFTILLIAFVIACGYIFFRFRRDMELRKLEEKKKDEITQFQLQFFTNISHEFRTPLTLILGPLEKLMKENSHAVFNHHYHSIQRNVHRLMDLISELMDFRKIETNSLKLNVRPENLARFLQEIAEEFEEWAEHKHISFTARNIEAIGETWFDKQVLEKIILNLLANSFKYTASGGHISLEVLSSLEGFTPSFGNELVVKSNYKAKRSFYIRVADNGIGISRDSIKHLFERYFRITESHLGSGVGLAFVKSLTFLHNGNIHVYSERHSGTEIIIAIPLGEENYSKSEKRENAGREGVVRLESLDTKYQPYISPGAVEESMVLPTTGNGVLQNRILIVEDNDELSNFLEDCLKPFYQVITAPEGKSGYSKAVEECPDLVISDVMMPGMDGIQLCRAVKNNIETSHIPFMLLTAKDALESKIEGVGSGADFYFAKPISIEFLLATIKNIFDQHRKLKERYSKDYNAQVKDLVNNSKDRAFMEQLLEIIESQLTNPELDIDFLCLHIGMSRTRLYNKIKQISGQSMNDFIRTIRLKKAVEIMTKEDVPFLEVMYRIGIQSQSYFTKAFKKEFGKTPTQFIQELQR